MYTIEELHGSPGFAELVMEKDGQVIGRICFHFGHMVSIETPEDGAGTEKIDPALTWLRDNAFHLISMLHLTSTNRVTFDVN